MTQERSLERGQETVHQGDTSVGLHESGDVTVTARGARFEIHEDGTIDAYTSGIVKLHPPDSESTAEIKNRKLEPGSRMPDGTIYAGISPDTGKVMYATPADAPLAYAFDQAQKYAATFDAHGHQDWRVPTKGELKVLFENRAAIGGFDVSDSSPAGRYWSSTESGHYHAWAQRFSGGLQNYYYKTHASSLRCVRE